MRSLLKEKRTVYISQVLPPIPVLDDNGNETGESYAAYDEPAKLRLNIKPITDTAERQSFGTDIINILKAEFTPYDVRGFDVSEHQAVWIGVEPNGNLHDGDITKPMNYNYTVEQVLDTGGQLSVYFKKKQGETKA